MIPSKEAEVVLDAHHERSRKRRLQDLAESIMLGQAANENAPPFGDMLINGISVAVNCLRFTMGLANKKPLQ